MRQRLSDRRPILVSGAAFVIGATLELLKARGHWFFEERAALGNVSTFWLLFSLVGGMTARSARRGALHGLASVMAALAGFYVAEAWVLQDAWGSSGITGGLLLCLSAGRSWFVLGALSGPVLGALGGWLRQHDRTSWAWAVAGGLFAFEPLALTCIDQVMLPVVNIRWWYEWGVVSFAEIAAGAGCVAVWARTMTQRSVGAGPSEHLDDESYLHDEQP